MKVDKKGSTTRAEIFGIGRIGYADLVDVIKSNEVISLDLSKKYYGDGKYEAEGCRRVQSNRYVFRGDDSETYVVIPEGILSRVIRWL